MGFRDDLFAARDKEEVKEQAVQFMGKTVYARALNAFWASVIESQRTRVINNQPVFDTTRDKVCMAVLGMYDGPGASGKLVFNQPKRVGFVDVNWSFSDELELGKFPAAEVARVAKAVAELSGMNADALAQAEKNSPETTTCDSSSTSPEN